ncbi:MAG: FAD-dependent monooxygenase [Burkholderiales bacterium]
MPPDRVDVLIVGGGPVGAAVALALRDSGLEVMVLESRGAAPRTDTRTLALSHGSRLILQRLGIWARLRRISVIDTIHVSQRSGLGGCVLDARDAGLPALGYVLRYAELQQALHLALQQGSLHYLSGAHVETVQIAADGALARFTMGAQTSDVRARLLVLAGGAGALLGTKGITLHTHDYRQSAVVAEVKVTHPRPGTAFERFTADGPVALLPCEDGYALIWTAMPETAHQLLDLDAVAFLEHLQRHFGDRVGRFREVGPRTCFPLQLVRAEPVAVAHAVLLGSAAQHLHPVAGQGYNVGLRDAWQLAHEILGSTVEHIGQHGMLERYQKARRADRNAGIGITHGLVKLFSNANPMLRHARGCGLLALDLIPPLKHALIERMEFGVGA